MFPKKLICHEYTSLPKEKRSETTDYSILNGELHMHIGDSKEAWVESLQVFMNAYTTDSIHTIFLDFDSIRPKGERIATFGGKAAGHEGMQDMFTKVASLLNSKSFLTPVDCVDICNLIALNVIVGGTRRSSEIALGHPDDMDFINAKMPENFSANPAENLNNHRTMSNNSIAFTQKPRLKKLSEIFENVEVFGEPGFFNLAAAQKRRPNAQGLNPCAEIILDSRGFCNLSTVVVTSHQREDGSINLLDLLESVRLATRIGIRLTNVTVSDPRWDAVQKRDRLIGVSMTGWMDALDLMGIRFDQPEATQILSMMRNEANKEATSYASTLRIPRPLLVTTVKPEGTLSQLPTVSSGLHRGYAPYYIRRIRVADTDAVAKALIEKGVPYVLHKKRYVFEFPVKTPARIAASEESALDQLERYFTFQKHYTDHNSSCTLTFDRTEVDEVVKRVHDRFDEIIGCAFMSKSNFNYPLMPYEECSQEEYERRALEIQSLDDLHLLVNKYETTAFEEELEVETDAACSTGVCPVR